MPIIDYWLIHPWNLKVFHFNVFKVTFENRFFVDKLSLLKLHLGLHRFLMKLMGLIWCKLWYLRSKLLNLRRKNAIASTLRRYAFLLYISLEVMCYNTCPSQITFEIIAHYTVSSKLVVNVLISEIIHLVRNLDRVVIHFFQLGKCFSWKDAMDNWWLSLSIIQILISDILYLLRYQCLILSLLYIRFLNLFLLIFIFVYYCGWTYWFCYLILDMLLLRLLCRVFYIWMWNVKVWSCFWSLFQWWGLVVDLWFKSIQLLWVLSIFKW